MRIQYENKGCNILKGNDFQRTKQVVEENGSVFVAILIGIEFRVGGRHTKRVSGREAYR